MSRFITTVAAIAATTLMSSAAHAGCSSGLYCNSNLGSTLPALSTWSGASAGNVSYTASPSYSYSTSPVTGTSYSYGMSNSYAGTVSSSYADATYGTGLISNAYTGSDVELFGFSGSTSSVGLGAGESLQSTSCPVNVFNPEGGTVLGCYNVVKPIPQTTYYRVVRPVVYVRYPVPVAVPQFSGCNNFALPASRYGGGGFGGFGGLGGFGGKGC
jgi:hypothetical protein